MYVCEYGDKVYEELKPLFEKVATPKQRGAKEIRKIIGRLAKEVRESPDVYTADKLRDEFRSILTELDHTRKGLFQDFVERHYKDEEVDRFYEKQPNFVEEFYYLTLGLKGEKK